jgi:hypothetical protein
MLYAAAAGLTVAGGGPAIRGVRGLARVVGSAASKAGAEAYVVGTLTATQIQRLIASSGDKVVTIFSKLTSFPAANRVLCASDDTRLCETIKNGTMYVGRIPYDLYMRLKYDGLISTAVTEMNNVRGTEIIIKAEAMPILQQYFQEAPK